MTQRCPSSSASTDRYTHAITARRDRLLILTGVVLFIIAFEWSYRVLIVPVWGYFGFVYVDRVAWARAAAWTICILPALWMPIRIVRASQVLYWLLYVTVYLPSILVPYYLGLQPPFEILSLSIWFLAGFGLIGLIYRVPLPRPVRWKATSTQFWSITAILYLSLLVFFLREWWPHLRLVTFAERYDVRLASREVNSSLLAEYSRSWIASVLTPLLIALGLMRKRIVLVVFGAANAVLLYSSSAARVWILVALYVPIGFYVLRRRRRAFGATWLWITCSAFLGCIGLEQAVPGARDVSDLLLLRVYVVPGFYTGLYSKFFSDHPFTYGSHMKGISLFVDYPYEAPIPFVMGNYQVGSYDISANAHVWAGDGIVSFGNAGILIVSAALGAVLLLADWCTQHLDISLAGIVVSAHYANLSNLPLSASLLGGGLLLSVVLLWIMPATLGGPGRRTSVRRQRHSLPPRAPLSPQKAVATPFSTRAS
jgi:hypothetical protein